MKKQTILSSVIAFLVLCSIYTFAFCFIRRVDDTDIPDDMVYNSDTETVVMATYAEKVEESLYNAEYVDKVADMPEETTVTTVSTVTDVTTVTTVPDTEKEEKTTTVRDLHKDFDDEQKYEDDIEKDDDLSDDDDTDYQSSNAVNLAGFAEKEELIVEDEPETTTVVTATEPPVTTTVKETVTEAEQSESFVPDVIIKGDGYNKIPETTTVTIKQENIVPDLPLQGDTLSVRINGTTVTDDGYSILCRVVANEISSSFSDEAIKAQAVSAYSYIKYNNALGTVPSVGAKSTAPQRIKDLVAQVYGQACYYNGKYAQTVYSASTAGYSSSAVNVWGTDVPYLVSVPCNVDMLGDPNFGVTKTFSEDTVRSYIQNSLGIVLSDNPSEWIKIMSYIDTSYVGDISIDGQKTITGRQLREKVFSYNLRSASFDVSYNNGQFVFTTYGYGHGVGMSQNGANILAKQGYSYVDILKYYYTGITVQ